ncbi:MAG: hypothetical protein JXA87_12640 [Thermoleophilia bacterium]|nr:hypothetical protein [Thermoleophilia bacterium]
MTPPATPDTLQSLRLVFKRAFTEYFLALDLPAIADPTEAFAAAEAYLSALHRQLGSDEFMRRLDDETTTLAGHVEQDLRHRLRGGQSKPDYEELEDRLRECFEHGLAQIRTRPERLQ